MEMQRDIKHAINFLSYQNLIENSISLTNFWLKYFKLAIILNNVLKAFQLKETLVVTQQAWTGLQLFQICKYF